MSTPSVRGSTGEIALFYVNPVVRGGQRCRALVRRTECGMMDCCDRVRVNVDRGAISMSASHGRGLAGLVANRPNKLFQPSGTGR